MPEPSIHKLYEKVEGLYNRDNLGLTYHNGKPLAVKKTCSWCVKGEMKNGQWAGCASKHFGSGCPDGWEGKR